MTCGGMAGELVGDLGDVGVMTGSSESELQGPGCKAAGKAS